MGKNTKLHSNPALAKAHEVGANVAVTQILAHAQYGSIGYLWTPRLWSYHHEIAVQACDRLRALHQEVLKLDIGPGNMRLIHDPDLLVAVYQAGSEMVSNAVRSAQHLTQDMERLNPDKSTLKAATIEDRLKEAAALHELDPHIDAPDYQGLVEINGVRDAIEHPKVANTYQGGQNEWDKVPLAWMISDRSLQAFEAIRPVVRPACTGVGRLLRLSADAGDSHDRAGDGVGSAIQEATSGIGAQAPRDHRLASLTF